MFEDREKIFKKMIRRKKFWKRERKKERKTRWQYIYDVMPKQELKQFLLEFIQKEKN